MSISNYSELKTAITAWTHRGDLTDYLDDFIDMAEAVMNRELRLSEMEVRATITAVSEYTALPTGMLELRNVQTNTTPVRTVSFRTPEQMDAANAGEVGTPRFYSIVGDEFQWYPVPSSSTMEADYYKSITPLDSTNTSNFLLASHPDLYLHGCLQQACIFTSNAEGAALHGQAFMRLIADLNRTSKRKKFSGAPLHVSPA